LAPAVEESTVPTTGQTISDEEAGAYFEAFDIDGSGQLNRDELLWMLKQIKTGDVNFSKAAKVWSTDGDDTVSKQEFIARFKTIASTKPQWVHAFKKAAAARAEAHDSGIVAAVAQSLGLIFDLFDVDESGCLTESEVLVVVKTLKPQQTEFDMKKVMEMWDATGDNKVSREEFVERIIAIAKGDADTLLKIDKQLKDKLVQLTSTPGTEYYALQERKKEKAQLLSGLSAQEKQQCADAFELYDIDCSDSLDEDQFHILTSVPMSVVDCNSDGRVECREFIIYMAKIKSRDGAERMAEKLSYYTETARMKKLNIAKDRNCVASVIVPYLEAICQAAGDSKDTRQYVSVVKADLVQYLSGAGGGESGPVPSLPRKLWSHYRDMALDPDKLAAAAVDILNSEAEKDSSKSGKGKAYIPAQAVSVKWEHFEGSHPDPRRSFGTPRERAIVPSQLRGPPIHDQQGECCNACQIS